MLNFKHFFKCTPEMYPRAPSFQISKYATGCRLRNMCMLSHGLLTKVSHSRLWFITLIPRSHESRMTAHLWNCDTHGYTQVIPL